MVEKTVDSPWHKKAGGDKLAVPKGTLSNFETYEFNF